MSTEQRPAQLPWQGLVAFAAALAGAVWYFAPLDTSRPPDRGGVSLKVSDPQDVDARLWQDPLAAAFAHEEQVRALSKEKDAASIAREKPLHAADELSSQVDDAQASHDLLVMPVLLSGGAYAEYGETRLRARRAVLEALGTDGLSPLHGEHIGYVRMPVRNNTASANPAPSSAASAGEAAMDANGIPQDPFFILPYEWCGPAFRRLAERPRRVLLLWIREEDLLPHPLATLDDILRRLNPRLERSRVRVIGPRTSSALRAIVDEVSNPGFVPALAGAAMFSASATMSEELLMRDRMTPESSTVKQLLEAKLNGFKFHRVTLTDDALCRALIVELGRRQVQLKLRDPPADHKPGMDHVALISEWDTAYGRALPLTFAREVSGEPLKQLERRYPKNLHAFHYLRGIDGMLPGAAGQDGAAKSGGPRPASNVSETTEGLNQADYLRRLAQQLCSLHRELVRKGEGGLKAVGVLGSDVYDKLLVLKALRRELPGVRFFTINLDARFAHPDEWRWTRNLIVASPFGLSLADRWPGDQGEFALQGKVLPFRDADQTATYASTLFASNPATGAVLQNEHSAFGEPRLFEIAQSGPYPLPASTPVGGHANLHPARAVHWWSAKRRTLLAGAALSVAALIGWVLLVVRARPRNTGATCGTLDVDPVALPRKSEHEPRRRVLDRLSGLPSWLVGIVAALAAWAGVAAIAHAQRPDGEPFLWTEGISIWPTETLRLLAFLMAGWFLFKTNRTLADNEAAIRAQFDLHPPDERAHRPRARLFSSRWWRQAFALTTLRRWRVVVDGRIVAQKLWHYYIRAGRWSVRALRVLPPAVFYMLAGVCLIWMLGLPPVPGRGAASFRWDVIFLALAVFGSVYLTFYVADATMLNCRLIKYLIVEKTRWPVNAYQHLRQRWTISAPAAQPPSTSYDERPPDRLLDEYLDIDLIAARTATVGELIYYPFIVITLLIISRIGMFDDWTWPVGLLLVVGGNGAFAAWSAWKLRSSAEHARQCALGKLNDILIARIAEGAGNQAEAQTARETIAMIRAENRGAFKAVSRHPLIGALLLPSGGAGIWALSQYLPHFL